ncbi:calmodulin-regulated spectrin-associated protein [Schistosoma bovis]|uniref:Calmodulin-regulated spectrin-associated protein n=1 Tax=Schistosoma bovis TaxID=6184 RepID=A0A430QTZ7_SCHBO|nr:calmodulin-regulated spectrin-associated protein [Schistosoma bovis]
MMIVIQPSGRGTYRLDETFNEHQRQVKQSKKQNLQTSYFIRSKTIRLNKNLSDVEKLNSKLKELSTKQLINSKTGGIYLPVDSTNTPQNEENKQDNVENQDESQNAPTKWNPLEALFKPNVLNEYQGNILNCKITNVDTAHVTTTTKSQYLKENPVTEEAQAPYNSQKIDSKSFRHSRSLSHNRMMPTYSSSQHKSNKYEDFNPSRRSGYRISHSRKHPIDHHDKNSRLLKWRHRPSRRKNNFTPYNVDGYSDSDLNTMYYNRNNMEYSSSDCSSSSEQSAEVLGEGIYSNYPNQKRHGHCPTFVNNAESRRTLTQNERIKLYNRERSKRRQRNIPETVNQPYFYGSHPFQQQVHCVYPYETANQKVYTDIHCIPYAPVQPTWIRPPFITNTLNPCPFYATNQPTFVGSPSVSVIPRLHSTSPLSFSHPNNPDQLLVYNLNEQNVLVPESNNPNVHIITEAVVSTESVNLQTEVSENSLNV